MLIALSKFFGVSVDYIIGNSDDFGIINCNKEIGENSFLSLYTSSSPQLQNAIKTILEKYNKK